MVASARNLRADGQFLQEIAFCIHSGNPQVGTAEINSNRE
jgi:hypothetical protein